MSFNSGNAPRLWFTAALLAVTIGAVYAPALDAPLIFDDRITIQSNQSIRSFWPLVGTSEHPGPFNPAQDVPTSARPLVNLTFAFNYYFGGPNPTGYHAVNVVIHFLSAMLVWAIVRRTLLLPYFGARFATSAGWLALAAALLWALHPLQTEAVIYATQRTELMMALFYLATLYCSLRYWSALPLPSGEGRGEGALKPSSEPGRGHRREAVVGPRSTPAHRTLWLVLATLACLCGMASKEVMVSAPLMVLLFDRTFVAGSLSKALRRSWPLYVGLASTWILLLHLSLGAPHGTSAGFGHEVSAPHWWLTQSKVFLMYLKLAVWPWPLLIHYQWPYFTTLAEAWVYVVPLLLLGIATLVLVWRNHPLGYLGVWIFAILAPTSIIPIHRELAAERRMYLPLLALVVLFVVGGYLLAQRMLRRPLGSQRSSPSPRFRPAAFLPPLLIAIVFGLVSAKRLAAYDDELALWQGVLRHQPNNSMAYNNLGLLFMNSNRLPEAIESLRAAVGVNPEYPDALNNLGIAFLYLGALPEAVETFQTALELKPDFPAALNNLGMALTRLGRFPEAIEHLQHAVRLEPDFAEARNNLGNALTNVGRLPEAIDELEAALVVDPNYVKALNNLGIALTQSGRLPEAIQRFELAVRLDPDYADARSNLGIALSRSGNPSKAIEHYRQALKSNPNHSGACFNLGNLLIEQGNTDEGIEHLEKAVRIRPEFADAHNALGDVFHQSGQLDKAIEHFQTVVRLKPNSVPAYAKLARAYNLANRSDDAIATAEKAIEVAQSTNQTAAVGEIEEWLSHYKIELKRARDSESAPQPQSRAPTE